MKRRAALLAGIALAGTVRAAQDNSIAAAMNDLQVRVERDLAYGSDRAQRLDAYLPGTVKGPILLVVHGGAWTGGDKASPPLIVAKVRYWTALGYVVVSANYRLLPGADPLEQARDVARALAFVQQRARTWGADPRKVVLMGHSSGAHLVSLLNAAPAIGFEEGAQPWRGTVSLDNPAMDVPALMRSRPHKVYQRAFGSDPRFWQQVSPVDRMSGLAPPLLAVCSRETFPQAQALERKARTFGRVVQVQRVPLAHLAISAELGLPVSYSDSVARWISSIL